MRIVPNEKIWQHRQRLRSATTKRKASCTYIVRETQAKGSSTIVGGGSSGLGNGKADHQISNRCPISVRGFECPAIPLFLPLPPAIMNADRPTEESENRRIGYNRGMVRWMYRAIQINSIIRLYGDFAKGKGMRGSLN